MSSRNTSVGLGNVRTSTSCSGHLCLIRSQPNRKSDEDHPCPYHSHVNENPDWRCRCCEACQQNCADDI